MDRQEAIYTGDIAMAMMRLAGEIPHGKDAVVQVTSFGGRINPVSRSTLITRLAVRLSLRAWRPTHARHIGSSRWNREARPPLGSKAGGARPGGCAGTEGQRSAL